MESSECDARRRVLAVAAEMQLSGNNPHGNDSSLPEQKRGGPAATSAHAKFGPKRRASSVPRPRNNSVANEATNSGRNSYAQVVAPDKCQSIAPDKCQSIAQDKCQAVALDKVTVFLNEGAKEFVVVIPKDDEQLAELPRNFIYQSKKEFDDFEEFGNWIDNAGYKQHGYPIQPSVATAGAATASMPTSTRSSSAPPQKKQRPRNDALGRSFASQPTSTNSSVGSPTIDLCDNDYDGEQDTKLAAVPEQAYSADIKPPPVASNPSVDHCVDASDGKQDIKPTLVDLTHSEAILLKDIDLGNLDDHVIDLCDDVIDLCDEDGLDALLEAEPPKVGDDAEDFVKALQSAKIPARAVLRVSKNIPCKDGKRRSVVTLQDKGDDAEYLSQLLVSTIVVDLATQEEDELLAVGGGVNRTQGPYLVVDKLGKSKTPLLRILLHHVKEKCGSTLFRITLVNHMETESDQKKFKAAFPSVADKVAGYLKENTTCFHEDKVRRDKVLMQAGPKAFEIGHGGKNCRQNLDDEQSKLVIRTTKMVPEVQATMHAGKKPANGKGPALTLQSSRHEPTDNDGELDDGELIQEAIAHFIVTLFSDQPGAICITNDLRQKFERMLDLDRKLGFGKHVGKALRRKCRTALENMKDIAEFFTNKYVLEYCRLRLFWGKIHDTMGMMFYRDAFWTPEKDKLLLSATKKHVRKGRVDWGAFMAADTLGWGRSKSAYQRRLYYLRHQHHEAAGAVVAQQQYESQVKPPAVSHQAAGAVVAQQQYESNFTKNLPAKQTPKKKPKKQTPRKYSAEKAQIKSIQKKISQAKRTPQKKKADDAKKAASERDRRKRLKEQAQKQRLELEDLRRQNLANNVLTNNNMTFEQKKELLLLQKEVNASQTKLEAVKGLSSMASNKERYEARKTAEDGRKIAEDARNKAEDSRKIDADARNKAEDSRKIDAEARKIDSESDQQLVAQLEIYAGSNGTPTTTPSPGLVTMGTGTVNQTTGQATGAATQNMFGTFAAPTTIMPQAAASTTSAPNMAGSATAAATLQPSGAASTTSAPNTLGTLATAAATLPAASTIMPQAAASTTSASNMTWTATTSDWKHFLNWITDHDWNVFHNWDASNPQQLKSVLYDVFHALRLGFDDKALSLDQAYYITASLFAWFHMEHETYFKMLVNEYATNTQLHEFIGFFAQAAKHCNIICAGTGVATADSIYNGLVTWLKQVYLPYFVVLGRLVDVRGFDAGKLKIKKGKIGFSFARRENNSCTVDWGDFTPAADFSIKYLQVHPDEKGKDYFPFK